MRATPLLDLHRELGASIGEFAGVRTAMDFGNPINEHVVTRTKAAIFDISHMARILISGKDSWRLIDIAVPRDLAKARIGFMFGPTAFLNERGGFKDDVMLYPLSENEWFVVGNAVNRDKDREWLRELTQKYRLNITVSDLTVDTAMVAIQGPEAVRTAQELGIEVKDLEWMTFRRNVNTPFGKVMILSRSGWTGEDGIEIVAEPGVAERIFRSFVEKGVQPAGLIARDTLRIEMGFRLYGAEIDESINPIEARYWVFTFGKKGCVGCDALQRLLSEGCDKQLVGLRLKKGVRFIPRHGYAITTYDGSREIGYVTSGAYSPVLQRSIALGYVSSRYAVMGLRVGIRIRAKVYTARIVDFPFIEKGR
ncbi:MAG: glycine cleavage system aminomethyltransferase GcvT [Thermoprotei archaeon]|nr:MAG: glycine cleavage system aminomethyltransferase GcvT [Thermoprotei archaeon]